MDDVGSHQEEAHSKSDENGEENASLHPGSTGRGPPLVALIKVAEARSVNCLCSKFLQGRYPNFICFPIITLVGTPEQYLVFYAYFNLVEILTDPASSSCHPLPTFFVHTQCLEIKSNEYYK